MSSDESFGGLEFNDNTIVYNKIGEILAYELFTVKDVYRLLLFDDQPHFPKLDDHRILVNFFQKSEPKFVVNFVERFDYRSRSFRML